MNEKQKNRHMAFYFHNKLWEDRGKDKGPNSCDRKKSKEKLQEQGKHYLEVEKKHSLVKNTCTSETVCAMLWFGSTTKYLASMSSKQVSFSTAAATP